MVPVGWQQTVTLTQKKIIGVCVCVCVSRPAWRRQSPLAVALDNSPRGATPSELESAFHFISYVFTC